MAFLGEWIKHIVLLILVATFMDLILPNSSMRKYVKLVVGFLLILLILSPILQIFQFDQDRLLVSLDELLRTDQQQTKEQVERERKRIEGLQQQLLQEEVQERWKEELTFMLETQMDLKVRGIDFTWVGHGDQLEIQELALTLEKSAEGGEFTERSSEAKGRQKVTSVEPIKDVDLVEEVIILFPGNKAQEGKSSEEVSEEQKKLEKEVLKLVQTEWNISVDKISIAWLRR